MNNKRNTKPSLTPRPFARAVSLAALLLTLSACSKSNPSSQAEPAAQQANGQALEAAAASTLIVQAEDLYTVTEQDLRHTVELTGAFDAIRRTQIRSKASGQVLEMPIREGDTLTQGGLIARIDPTEAQIRVKEREAILASQQAQLAQAEQQFNQSERLFKQNFVSEAALTNARATRDAAAAQVQAGQAQLDLSRQQLRDTEIHAPYSGLVGATQIQVGSKVSVDTPLLELMDISTLEFKAMATAEQLQHLRQGQTVKVYTDTQPAGLEGTLTRISPSTSSGSRSVPIFIRLPNPGLAIRAGQFGNARVQTARQSKGLLVPLAAVRESQARNVVYAVTPQGMVLEQVVTLGAEQNQANGSITWVEVTSGLKVGQTIVGVNLGPLREGSQLQVRTQTPRTGQATQPASTPPSGH